MSEETPSTSSLALATTNADGSTIEIVGFDGGSLVDEGVQDQNTSDELVCLICDEKLSPPSSVSSAKDLIDIDEDDAANYRAFLAKTYSIDFDETVTSAEAKQNKTKLDVLSEFPLCKTCFGDVKKLYEEQEKLNEIQKNFSKLRDGFALKILGTYLQRATPPEEVGKAKGSRAAKAVEASNQEKVATAMSKWKHVYTGELDKQMDINQLLFERELEVVEREHRRLKEIPTRKSSTAKYLAHMQKAMTACFFTPKLSVKRKRNKLYFEVSIPEDRRKEKHVCNVCCKEFQRMDSLNIHMRTHATRIKLYKCTQSSCNRTFVSTRRFRRHKRTHGLEEAPQIKCRVCGKVFRTKSAIRSHMKRTHNMGFHESDLEQKYSATSSVSSEVSVQDLFTCTQCAKVFLKSSELTEHSKIHEEPNMIGCDFCGKGFSSKANLQEHMAIHFGSNPYICDECGIRFASEQLLISHLKTHRPRGFTCTACGKACRSRDGLRKHELTHALDRPFICSVCGVGFIERKSLEAHMAKHTGKLPFNCSLCKDMEGFRDAKDLRKHRLEMHPELTPNGNTNVCEFCWNSFNDFDALQDHVSKVHERYKCHVCSRVFKLGDHLRRHMYIHTGEKPFKCKLCDKMFNQESNLKEHMYRHTGIRPHQCPHCPGVGYLRRVQLKEHMLKEHGTDEVPSLPMGRAAQNARKSGIHPVPEPLAEIITSQALMSAGTSSFGTFGSEAILPLIQDDLKLMQGQIPLQGQIVYQADGTPVFIRKVVQTTSSRAANTQKLTPIIMRNVPNTSAATSGNVFFEQQIPQLPQPRQQAMVLKRPIPIRNVAKRPATFEETTQMIPVHRIKKDPGGFEMIETSDPNQQQIIIYTV